MFCTLHKKHLIRLDTNLFELLDKLDVYVEDRRACKVFSDQTAYMLIENELNKYTKLERVMK